MEQTEVEVLEPKENWEKEIPELAELVSVSVPVQTIIINGERQEILGEAYVLICPKCRAILYQFQPGISAAEILKSLNTDDENELGKYMYCKACGQKLSLMRKPPVDAEYTEIKEETTI